MDNEYAIGVDLGGTKLNVGAVDKKGHIKERIIVPTDVAGGSEAIIKQIIGISKQLQQKIGCKPIAIGLGIAGQIDAETGNVYFAPNLKWHNVPIQSILEQALEFPIAVTNDVRAAAWGEWHFGAGRNCNDFVCLFLGTGIGGGIVSCSRMLSGHSNSAGEIGHIIIAFENGRECFCGSKGCLEAYAGGWAITKRAKEKVSHNPIAGNGLLSLAGNIENITTKMIAEAFNKGNLLAEEIVKETAEALIAGSVTIVNAFNPQKLIFGGGITKGFPKLIEMVSEGVKKSALKIAVKNLVVEEAQIFADAGIVGASVFARQTIKGKVA